MTKPFQFGTKEWTPYTYNFVLGCSNDCVYCYAKAMMIRYKKKQVDTWNLEEPVDLSKRSFGKKDGPIMVPSSHDITPTNIDLAVEVIEKLLKNENELLIVTKPHIECIKRLVDCFQEYRSLIRFRFTIGSSDSNILSIWEPNAPSFEERLESLKYAFHHNYSTSVSCEPLLDDDFDSLYGLVQPFVTDAIWVGKMNNAARRVQSNTAKTFDVALIDDLLASQCDEKILTLVQRYQDNPKIQWKESIKKVLLKSKKTEIA